MNAIYSFYINCVKHLFSFYALFVFYINKMFIRLNKTKILRSASCLLFLFIEAHEPHLVILQFVHKKPQDKSSPTFPYSLSSSTDSVRSLFLKKQSLQYCETLQMLVVACPLSQVRHSVPLHPRPPSPLSPGPGSGPYPHMASRGVRSRLRACPLLPPHSSQ